MEKTTLTPQRTVGEIAHHNFWATRWIGMPLLAFMILYMIYAYSVGPWLTKKLAPPLLSAAPVHIERVPNGLIRTKMNFSYHIVKSNDWCKFDSVYFYGYDDKGVRHDIYFLYNNRPTGTTHPPGESVTLPLTLLSIPKNVPYIQGVARHRCWWLPNTIDTLTEPVKVPHG